MLLPVGWQLGSLHTTVRELSHNSQGTCTQLSGNMFTIYLGEHEYKSQGTWCTELSGRLLMEVREHEHNGQGNWHIMSGYMGIIVREHAHIRNSAYNSSTCMHAQDRKHEHRSRGPSHKIQYIVQQSINLLEDRVVYTQRLNIRAVTFSQGTLLTEVRGPYWQRSGNHMRNC
jgi:hypothetical protein